MADLLSHVLVAYTVLTVLGWRVGWIGRRWVIVGMGGAAIPDLVKIGLVVEDAVVQGVLGVPFSWSSLGSLWGLLFIGCAVTLMFPRDLRRRAVFALLLGGGSSLVLDGMRMFADGRGGFWLYPLWWRPPTPNLYVSADWRVLVMAMTVALGVSRMDRRFF